MTVATARVPISFNPFSVSSPSKLVGIQQASVGTVLQTSTDEFGITSNAPHFSLVQQKPDTVAINLLTPDKNTGKTVSVPVGVATGTLPEDSQLNVVSGKDGVLAQLKFNRVMRFNNPWHVLANKSLIVPEGGSLTIGDPQRPMDAKIPYFHVDLTGRKLAIALDATAIPSVCDTTPEVTRSQADEDVKFELLFPIGGAGSRLFPLSSPVAYKATLADGSTREAFEALAKPACWLPCKGESMIGRALYYFAQAGITTVHAPIVNGSAPQSIQSALQKAETNVEKRLNVNLTVNQIMEDRLGGQSSYVPELWETKLKLLYEAGETVPYMFNEFCDATFLPAPPYEAMMNKVRTEKPDGLVLVKPVEQLDELVNKYGETTYSKKTGELLGMHEKPKTLEIAKQFAQQDLDHYNHTHEQQLSSADEGVGFRLGTEVYGAELLKAACTEQEDGYPLLADRSSKGEVRLTNGLPIFSMYNVFHAVGNGTAPKKADDTALDVKVMELPKQTQWLDMGNYNAYMQAVAQLYQCEYNQTHHPAEGQHLPIPIGATQFVNRDNSLNHNQLYGKGVLPLFKATNLNTTGAVALVDSKQLNSIN
jgi:hypothetical protein